MDVGSTIGALVGALAIIGFVWNVARGATTRSDMEAKIKELREERERVSADVKVEIRVALKRAEDAHSAFSLLQQDFLKYQVKCAADMLTDEALDKVEKRLGQYIVDVKNQLHNSIKDVGDRVDRFAAAVIEAAAKKPD